MSLREHEITIIGAWMERKGVKAACPACGRRDWGLSDIIGLPVLEPDAKEPGDEYVPAAAAVCGNCGFIMPFSARMMGLR